MGEALAIPFASDHRTIGMNFSFWDWQHSDWLVWHQLDPKRTKASAFTSARLTRDLIIIARTTRATGIIGTQMSIGGIGGTATIIGTTTIRIPVGITIRIDKPSAKFWGRFFPSDYDS